MTPGVEAALAALELFMWIVGGLLAVIGALVAAAYGTLVHRTRRADSRMDKVVDAIAQQIGGLSKSLQEAVKESLEDRHALRVMLEGHNHLILGHARELEATQKRLNNHADRLKEHGETLVKHGGLLAAIEREAARK